MANAKKCDRCGGYYEPIDLGPISEACEKLNNTLRLGRDKARTKDRILETIDLCPKCQNTLDDWLRGYEPLVISAEEAEELARE